MQENEQGTALTRKGFGKFSLSEMVNKSRSGGILRGEKGQELGQRLIITFRQKELGERLLVGELGPRLWNSGHTGTPVQTED